MWWFITTHLNKFCLVGHLSVISRSSVGRLHYVLTALLLLLTIGEVRGDDVNCTLTNANIVAGGTGATGYGNKSMTDGCSHTWTAYAIKDKHSNATSSYHYLQIRAKNGSTKYWIQVPEYTGYTIKSITMVVSGASQPSTDGNNSATLYFSASDDNTVANSGVAANPQTAVSGTGASSVTLDCSPLGLSTGYITASAGVRVWGDVIVTYEPSCTPLGTINGPFTLSRKQYLPFSAEAALSD